MLADCPDQMELSSTLAKQSFVLKLLCPDLFQRSTILLDKAFKNAFDIGSNSISMKAARENEMLLFFGYP